MAGQLLRFLIVFTQYYYDKIVPVDPQPILRLPQAAPSMPTKWLNDQTSALDGLLNDQILY